MLLAVLVVVIVVVVVVVVVVVFGTEVAMAGPADADTDAAESAESTDTVSDSSMITPTVPSAPGCLLVSLCIAICVERAVALLGGIMLQCHDS
jgi:hypothetical protein